MHRGSKAPQGIHWPRWAPSARHGNIKPQTPRCRVPGVDAMFSGLEQTAMLRPLVLLWLAAPNALPEHRPDIVRWATARGFGPVAEPPGVVQSPYDDAAASQIEALLEEARTAPSARADVFEKLERLLTMHPHLPQAAWLSAERHVLQARAEARGGADAAGAARAAELERRSVQLEGPRALPFGQAERRPGGVLPPGPSGKLQVEGLRPRDRVFMDGLPLAPDASSELGHHHVQVFRGDTRLWAGWLELGSPPRLSIDDPTVPCSELDLAGVTAGPNAPAAPPGILCQRWAAARPNLLGGVDVAECNASECNAWAHHPPSDAERKLELADQAPAPAAKEGLPSWLTWSAVGVGAATTVGLILWRSGAFERSDSATEFVFTGPTAAALRF